MQKRSSFAAALLLCLSFIASAQSPKRELRAAWIATVANIDWPSKPGLPSDRQQAEFIARLDEMKAVGCNAVIVQVRPAADAFYNSPYEPWSRYLTGKQGVPPSPYYDPLEFMVREAHARQMEFHAWFNPFRALTDSRRNPNPMEHVTHKHSDWIVSYDGKSYINPGIPEARQYVNSVILDVVKRYDIDAVHLDDYFYPYPAKGKEFMDFLAFSKYGGGMSRGDWRRNNVSLFIEQLNADIKRAKPYVKLGISPFGVWRNQSLDPDGSPTRAGVNNYDDLYADVVLWIRRGWIDYLMPQLYWEHGHRAAPFERLLPWWEAHAAGRHVYYGLGMYNMVNATKPVWRTCTELQSQIRDVRAQARVPGFSLYSISCMEKAGHGTSDSLASLSNYPALVPPMRWLDSIPPAAPVASLSGGVLSWKTNNPSGEPLHYVVYRFPSGEAVNLQRSDRILRIQDATTLPDAGGRGYTYVVTALDRLWNESGPGNAVKAK